MVSTARKPITPKIATQRLIKAVFEEQQHLLLTPDEQATWVSMLIKVAAYVAGVPEHRRSEVIQDASRALLPDIVFRDA